jgi:hypothetical protein
MPAWFQAGIAGKSVCMILATHVAPTPSNGVTDFLHHTVLDGTRHAYIGVTAV